MDGWSNIAVRDMKQKGSIIFLRPRARPSAVLVHHHKHKGDSQKLYGWMGVTRSEQTKKVAGRAGRAFIHELFDENEQM